MANAFRLGATWSAAVLAFAACSTSPNGAGEEGGANGFGDDGAVVGSGEGGGSMDSATAASSSSGSSSGVRAGSSSSSGGANASSSSSSSGGGVSSSSSGGIVDAGCAASCDQVKRCCPVLSPEAGSLIHLCNSAAMSCKDSQCMQFLTTFALGACPP